MMFNDLYALQDCQKTYLQCQQLNNLDHNPSSSTAKDSFHGTGISIFQFQTNQDDSFKFELSKTSRNNDSPPSLPSYYTNVKTTKSTPSKSRISINSMNSMDVDHFDESKGWLNHIHDHLDDEEMLQKCNWASFNASQVQHPDSKHLSAMLSLLKDEVATHGTVRDTMDIIDKVHKKLKLDQPLVITADQPVYVIGK